MVVINKILAVALAFGFWISDDSVKAQKSSMGTSHLTNPSTSVASSSPHDTGVMVSSANNVQPIQEGTHDINHSFDASDDGSGDGSEEMSTVESNGDPKRHSLDSPVKEKGICGLNENEMFYIILAAVGGTVLGISLSVVILCLVFGRQRKSKEAISEEDALSGGSVEEASNRVTSGEATSQATGETNDEASNRATSETNNEALTPVASNRATSETNGEALTPVAEEPAQINDNAYTVLPV